VERNKVTFKAVVGGAEREYCVTRPDSALKAKAQLFKASKIREAASGGALLRDEVGKLLRDRGVWDDEKDDLYVRLATAIKADEAELVAAKKRGAKKSEGKDIALRMAANFQNLQALQTERTSLDHLTAEGMAASGEFDFLLAHSVKTADGKPYYASYDDMAGRVECPVFEKAKEAFMELLYGGYEDQLKKRPEWQFLLQHGYVNDKLRLVNKEGQLVDGLGRRVDADGRLVNDQGELVDDQGRRVDDRGFLLADGGEWAEDDGPVEATEDVTASVSLLNSGPVGDGLPLTAEAAAEKDGS
jgi:hypothetical protein